MDKIESLKDEIVKDPDFMAILKSALEFQLQQSLISNNIQSFFNTLTTAEQVNQPRGRVDPLTLDLDGDGIELINVTNSNAFFDLDLKPIVSLAEANDIRTNSSNPNYNPNAIIYSVTNSNNSISYYLGDGLKEQVGWVKGDDALLVLDRNNNQSIDNILELFGKSNKTGTEELREYDLNNAPGGSGIADGIINNQDAIFSKLQLWQDLNGLDALKNSPVDCF